MQWSTEPNAGFSKNPKPAAAVISSGPYAYGHVNAAQQRREPNSLLNWTERLIRMRKEVPEIGWGDFQLLATGDEAVLAIRYDWRNNSVVFVHNLTGTPREIGFDVGLPGENAGLLVNLLSEEHSRSRDSRHHMLLEGYGYRWFRVGGLDYLLRRSAVDEGPKARGTVRRRRPGRRKF
jgi:maltose alpha-D-glucosyltransferase/alpha-amylase